MSWRTTVSAYHLASAAVSCTVASSAALTAKAVEFTIFIIGHTQQTIIDHTLKRWTSLLEINYAFRLLRWHPLFARWPVHDHNRVAFLSLRLSALLLGLFVLGTSFLIFLNHCQTITIFLRLPGIFAVGIATSFDIVLDMAIGCYAVINDFQRFILNKRQKKRLQKHIILARTTETGQGLGRILSCGARRPEQT